jgi:hypothetical protein
LYLIIIYYIKMLENTSFCFTFNYSNKIYDVLWDDIDHLIIINNYKIPNSENMTVKELFETIKINCQLIKVESSREYIFIKDILETCVKNMTICSLKIE